MARRAVAAVVEDAARRGVEYRVRSKSSNRRDPGRLEQIATSKR